MSTTSTRAPLSADELSAWDRDGYHVQRGLFESDEVAAIRDRFDRIAERGEPIRGHWQPEVTGAAPDGDGADGDGADGDGNDRDGPTVTFWRATRGLCTRTISIRRARPCCSILGCIAFWCS